MKHESLQSNDPLSLLECVQDGGEIDDYPYDRSHEYVRGMVYCNRQDGTLANYVPFEILDAVVLAGLLKPETISPPLGPEGLTTEQMERTPDWEVMGYSLTEQGAEFLQSGQRQH